MMYQHVMHHVSLPPSATLRLLPFLHEEPTVSLLQVTVAGGEEYRAKVIGFDEDKDVAVLRLKTESEVRDFSTQ